MKRVLLGVISSAHGIRGEVIVKSFTADPTDVGAYGALTDEAGHCAVVLEVLRSTPKGVVTRVHGITDRTAAEALKGRRLFVDRACLPVPNEDEYYHEDLIGLRALLADGSTVGTVTAVHNYGAGDLLAIRADGGTASELIPFTRAAVPSIDFNGGTLIVVRPASTGEEDDGPSAGSRTGV
jgi:16S rRNA processing protein RimM